MTQPLASLSLDLDNKWSYLKTHGDPGWERFPTYLDAVVPRALAVLDRLDLKITFFVVGQDAALAANRRALALVADSPHEVANHSFRHEPWLHRYSPAEIDAELAQAEAAIQQATGRRTVGFRGPGYSLSPDVLRVVVRRGYQYDASTFPTFLGPAARAYYFFRSRLSRSQRAERKLLFGRLWEGFRPLTPYWWQIGTDRLLEIPVTTLPIARTPIHLSYLLYLWQFSHAAALAYCRTALALCRARGVEPSLLLHPLDFVGRDEQPELAFFPAMGMPSEEKTAFVGQVLALFAEQFEVLPLGEYAARVGQRALRVLPLAAETTSPGTTQSAVPAAQPAESAAVEV
jgi:hypothetical protein